MMYMNSTVYGIQESHTLCLIPQTKAALFRRALIKLQTNDQWILSQTSHGITTYYRKETDGSLSIKMEGRMEGVPLFDQVAVIREVDLHHTWAPFCTSSLTLKEMNKCDSVGWFVMGAPQLGLSRDGIFRAVGCDNMTEDGSFLIVGQGLHDRPDTVPYAEPYLAEGLEGITFPPKPTRIGSGRMTLRHFSARIDVVSPTCCDTKLVANVDPNLPLPQSLLDFVTRKICGVVMQKVMGAAKKVAKDPVRNPHARRIRQENEFYEGWLLPKFQAFCELRNWTMPKVAALELNDEQQEKEFEYQVQKKNSSEVAKQSDDASTSSVSPLTVASMVTKNPISRYFRETEAKAQAKKALRIAASRQRVEHRLKAKHLSEYQMIRLEELKEAKERRMLNNGIPSVVTEVEKDNEVRKTTWDVSQFQEHSWKTRLLTITTLCFVVTIVLNPDMIISDVFGTFDGHGASWWFNLFIDGCAVAYIGFCAFVHFIVCDVAMLYAFGALDIGMKTGKQSKKFYGDTVRMVVALMSGSVAVFSVGKAIAAALTRALVWYFMRGIEQSQELVAYVRTLLCGFLPASVVDLPGRVLFLCGALSKHAVLDVAIIAKFMLALLHTVFIKSNPFGRLAESIVFFAFQLAAGLFSRLGVYHSHVRDIDEDVGLVRCWRLDAIETSRVLLTYTMVFLLSMLILFNASSRWNKRMNEKWDAVVNHPSMSLLGKTTPSDSFPVLERSTPSGASCMGEDDDVSVIPEPPLPNVTETTQPRLKLHIRRSPTKGTSLSTSA